MEQNYQEVPNIISCKDLDYLSDMFNWNYGVYKSAANSSKEVTDMEIKSLLDKAANVFHGTMTTVLNIINVGGSNEQ